MKLRLGRRSLSGEQKGVDLRIGLDLAAHGRSRVVDVMYLVSGDDDLTEAVEEAQNHGVRVQLIVVPNHASRPMSVAKHLQQAADGVLLADGAAIDAAVRRRSIPAELAPLISLHPPPCQSLLATRKRRRVRGHPRQRRTPSPDHPASVPSPSILAGEVDRAGAAALRPHRRWLGPATLLAVTRVVRDRDQFRPDRRRGPPGHRRVVQGRLAGDAGPPSLGGADHSGDLDRALLVDLSNVSGVYDIPDSARFELRERWVLVERIKLA